MTDTKEFDRLLKYQKAVYSIIRKQREIASDDYADGTLRVTFPSLLEEDAGTEFYTIELFSSMNSTNRPYIWMGLTLEEALDGVKETLEQWVNDL